MRMVAGDVKKSTQKVLDTKKDVLTHPEHLRIVTGRPGGDLPLGTGDEVNDPRKKKVLKVLLSRDTHTYLGLSESVRYTGTLEEKLLATRFYISMNIPIPCKQI
ncbi:hypothetical protein FKM82_010241 [Ascaphus truei]